MLRFIGDGKIVSRFYITDFDELFKKGKFKQRYAMLLEIKILLSVLKLLSIKNDRALDE